jgi:hypothetical protein
VIGFCNTVTNTVMKTVFHKSGEYLYELFKRDLYHEVSVFIYPLMCL